MSELIDFESKRLKVLHISNQIRIQLIDDMARTEDISYVTTTVHVKLRDYQELLRFANKEIRRKLNISKQEIERTKNE